MMPFINFYFYQYLANDSDFEPGPKKMLISSWLISISFPSFGILKLGHNSGGGALGCPAL